MVVGVGVPEPILQEMIASLTITNRTLVPAFLKLLEQEITSTKAIIDKTMPTSVYSDERIRWAHHLEAYERVRDILLKLMGKKR